MRLLTRFCRFAIGTTLAALVPLSAESGQALPGQGLFGETPETNRPVSSAGISLYGGAGDSGGIGAVPDPLLGSSYFAGFMGGLSHRRQLSRYTFSAAAGTSYRYFPDIRELVNLDGSGAVSLSRQVTSRGTLRVSQTAQYTRFRQFGPVPTGPTDPTDPTGSDSLDVLPASNPEGAATVGQPFYSLNSSVSFSQSLGPRAGLWADYSYWMSVNQSWSQRPDTHDARFRYFRGAGRSASVWAGTSYRTGQTSFEEGVPRIRANDFEGGVAYTRRQTTLTASSGVTLVTRAGQSPSPDVTDAGLDYQVMASMGIGQQFRESWNLYADYSRRVQFVEAFPDPFASDQANGMLSGRLGRRMELSGRASFWTGTATATTANADQHVTGWQVAVRLGAGLARRARTYVQYHYTANQFSEGALASLPPGVLPRTNWGGVYVGLDLWAAHVH
jgi:hypothetical protein